MKIGVSLNIDVTKLDKFRFHKGKNGTYADMTVFIDVDEKDQYGNSGMITQNVSKEEREQGVKGPILGNCKVFYKDGSAKQQYSSAPNQPNVRGTGRDAGDGTIDDDIPF